MRANFIKEIQKKIESTYAYLINDEPIVEYILDIKNVKVLLILKDKVYIITNSILYNINFGQVISTNNITNEIKTIIINNNIKNIYSDYNNLSVLMFNDFSTNTNIIDRKIDTIIKMDIDNDIMKINAIILSNIIKEFLNKISSKKTFLESKNIFQQIAFKYNISDYFFSCSKSNKVFNSSDNLGKESILFFDCGIKYKGLYSDFTFAVKFSEFSKEEIEFLNDLENIMLFLSAKISNITSPSEIIKKLKEINIKNEKYKYLESGFGHSVGVHVHENYSICNTEQKCFNNNLIFTLEPLFIIQSKNSLIKYRLESTYGYFDNKLVNYFENTNKIYQIMEDEYGNNIKVGYN